MKRRSVLTGALSLSGVLWGVLSVVVSQCDEVGEADDSVADYVGVRVPVQISGSRAVGVCKDNKV